MRKILIVLGILVVVIAGISVVYYRIWWSKPAPTQPKAAPVIGFSLGAVVADRWHTDRDLFVQRAEQLGAKVDVLQTSVDSDPATQISQIENMISQGIKLIVVVAADSNKLGPEIQKAHDQGIKIIAYDRLINDCDLDFYVSFDNVKVGALQAQSVVSAKSSGNFVYLGGSPTDNNAFLVKQGAMSVLQPKIDSGDIKLVFDRFIPHWATDAAYSAMKSYLATSTKVDAVVAANDKIALGAIKALAEAGLAGKVPVSGQDAELSACQRIAQGTQTSTVYKPIKNEADAAAEAAVAMINGQTPSVNNIINNKKINVPSYFITPTLVTKDNLMTTVIKDGFHTYQEVYGTSAK
ncbi:MAG TPA: substrate-binding domain-containing protein [Candidatus Nanoarchaeia archaeon]|nr:substrate-binding domain-containing protein [Candidatus Nanoarchaeia archaeon]